VHYHARRARVVVAKHAARLLKVLLPARELGAREDVHAEIGAPQLIEGLVHRGLLPHARIKRDLQRPAPHRHSSSSGHKGISNVARQDARARVPMDERNVKPSGERRGGGEKGGARTGQ
jgi:hypothetical protein